MKTRRDKIALWFSALAFVLACIPSTSGPISTIDPQLVEQFIIQTADAAQTQTAKALPTATGTVTITSTPEGTFTPSATSTSTVIFLVASATDTLTETATFAVGGGGTSDDDFACEVLSVTPVNGTTFNGGDAFDVTWQVKNIGQHKWNEGAIRYVFESGVRLHTVGSYELESDVRSGGTASLTAEMEAPNSSGSYTTTWALRRGNESFCQLFLTIHVR